MCADEMQNREFLFNVCHVILFRRTKNNWKEIVRPSVCEILFSSSFGPLSKKLNRKIFIGPQDEFQKKKKTLQNFLSGAVQKEKNIRRNKWQSLKVINDIEIFSFSKFSRLKRERERTEKVSNSTRSIRNDIKRVRSKIERLMFYL